MDYQTKSFLGNITVSLRITILLAIMILGNVLVSGTLIVGDNIAKTAAAKKAAYQQLNDLSSALTIRGLEMRRNEKDFLLRRDKKYIDKYNISAEETLEILAQMQSSPFVTENQRERITLLTNYAQQHKAKLKRVSDIVVEVGMSEEEGLRGWIRKSVHDIESELKKYNSDRLMVSMLMMRRHEKDFLLREAEKYVEKMNTENVEFQKKAAASDLPATTKKNIFNLLDKYHESFVALAEKTLSLKVETKTLSAIYSDFSSISEPLANEIIEAFEFAKKEEREIANNTESAVNILQYSIMLVVIALGIVIARSISIPLREIASITESLANEEDVDVLYSENKDEIGTLSRALEIFKQHGIEKVGLENEQKRSEERTAEEKKQIMHDLASRFEDRVQEMIHSVASAATELSQTSESVKQNVENVDKKASDAMASSERTSQTVNTVASASEQMAASVKEISNQVTKSTQVVNEAVRKAENAGSSAKTLEEATVKIGDIIGLIRDIAEQINLLALNATIESARAGDAGKGFAVVASEVKNLATQTTKATEEISQQIEGVQGVSSEVVESLNSIKQAVDNVNEYAGSIASAVEEQTATTNEIAHNMTIAAQGTQEINDNVTCITNTASQASASSVQMLSASQLLSKDAEKLSSEVALFLAELRE